MFVSIKLSSSVSNGNSSTKDFNGELSTGIASIPLSFKNCLATFKSEAFASGSFTLLSNSSARTP